MTQNAGSRDAASLNDRDDWERVDDATDTSDRAPKFYLRTEQWPGYVNGGGHWRHGVLVYAGERRAVSQLADRVGTSRPEQLQEAFLESWAEQGRKLLENLTGGLALVVWNGTAETLLAARGPFGIVPLVSSATSRGSITVSTSPGRLVEGRSAPPRFNRSRLRRFLEFNAVDTARNDFLRGVSRILPGETAVWRNGIAESRETEDYWSIPERYAAADRDAPAFARDRFRSVLSDFRVEDAPTLVSLSGGMDSPFLAASLASQIGASNDAPLSTASMVFSGFPSADERERIDAIEQVLPIENTRVPLDDTWPLRSTDPYIDHPATGPRFHAGENYETEFLRRVREVHGSCRLLMGTGGDRLFRSRLRELLRPKSLARGVQQHSERLIRLLRTPDGLKGLLRNLLSGTGLLEPTRDVWRLLRYQFARHEMRPPWQSPNSWLRGAPSRAGSDAADDVFASEARFLRSWLWERVMRMGWRKMRRTGVGIQYPYLDADFYWTVRRIDPWIRLGDGRPKSLLHRMARDWLPDPLLEGADHTGFDEFVHYGLCNQEASKVRDLAARPGAVVGPMIDEERFRTAIEVYLHRCRRPRDRDDWTPPAGALPLWKSLSAILWTRHIPVELA